MISILISIIHASFCCHASVIGISACSGKVSNISENPPYNSSVISVSWTMGSDVTQRCYRYTYNRYSWLTLAEYRKVHMVRFPGGYATVKDGAVTFHYYTRDYLGNNRAVINGSTGAIEQTTAYYPYGGVIADLGTGNSGQPFKFGGKELIRANGFNEYDFGARRYYQAVPHFTSIDPMCEKYYWLSPYLYCANNPVNCIDPEGATAQFRVATSTGNPTWHS